MKKASVFFKQTAVICFLSICSNFSAQNNTGNILQKEYEELEAEKSHIINVDKEALQNYNEILQKADSLLNRKSFSVVNKTGIPPSKTKHDYMSIGPYWWPNPETANGLPYIRKDGEINPETRNSFTDYVEKKSFISTVKVLTKAYNLSNEKKYAFKNLELINAWFLDDDTKMNPNVNYGQYVPGKSEGRCFGIIEFAGLKAITKFLELAKDRNILDEKTEVGMFNWFTEYINWLQNSKLGKEAIVRENNHGTHYDLQLLDILLYLNKKDVVKKHLSTITKARIFSQIDPDGSQPHELARTTSFSYSTMNLNAFLELVRLGRKVNINLWEFTSEDGRSIKAAYQYLMPYLTDEKKWTYQQIKSKKSSEAKLIRDLNYISENLKDRSFDNVLLQLNQKNNKH